MGRALVIGAGAIGRGFLPWALGDCVVDFYDASAKLVAGIRAQGGFHTHRSKHGSLETRFVRPAVVTDDIAELDLGLYDVALVSVGPRNVEQLPKALAALTCPVFSLENDPTTVEVIRDTLGIDQAYFGVPDVIAASSASPASLAADPWAIHTEAGVLYLEDPGPIRESLQKILPTTEWLSVERLRQEWAAKLYLHNTPHCVAAYLGKLAGFRYLHEGFTNPNVERVVNGVIEEMLLALKLALPYDHAFLESYAAKELERFADPLLFDPIARVAREPLRKLQATGRLTGALRLALSTGVAPTYLMLGIAAALRYDEPTDPDFEFVSKLDAFGVAAFLKYHLMISPDSLESQVISNRFDTAWKYLQECTS